MKYINYSPLYLLLLLLTGVFVSIEVSAGLKEAVLKKSIVNVKTYIGKEPVAEGTAVIVQSDRYNGYVVTNASLIIGKDTLTVNLPGNGAELIAQIIKVDESLDIAILKVNGLTLPALRFSEKSAEPGDVVWSAVRWQGQQWQAQGGVIGLSKGSLRNRYNLPRGNVEIISHDAIVGEGGVGSVLLNDCGELIGLNMTTPSSDTNSRAIGSRSLIAILKSLNIRTWQAKETCVSEVELARSRADFATEEALKATTAAALAQKTAALLETKLKVTDRVNRSLEIQVKEAQAQAERAMAAAEEARTEAAETRIELERKTASILEETESMMEHLQQDRAEAEERFSEALSKQEQASASREKLILLGFVVFVLVLVGLIVLLQQGPFFKKLTSLKPGKQNSPEPVTSNRTVASEKPSEYVLEGRDDAGIRYLLRISGDQMRALGGVVIGRNPKDSPYIINHVDVSRMHARLKMIENRVFIEDLGSTNGTVVNGQAIDEKGAISVNSGDQIVLGSVVLKLRALNR